MKTSNARKISFRQLFAPALLAMAIMPLAFAAQAHSHGDHEGQGPDHERMEERMEERRQEVYERADISVEKQAELNEAHAEHREAMQALREEHHARVAEILTEEEQEALRNAMQEAHEEYRAKHGKGGPHGNHKDENADSE
ncbi:hypothetical protein QT231_05985 [Halomonas sp. SpR1]|uniref:hypothetical protein n=1 Tax=Halomonas sp. SpR1 TaxID=3050462 RepID=UPI0027E51A02|nr:hypothetical protein [Halomonas sp. SpR1]MDQ7732240.1 hypothetical protein [Halomonas sp. SpR1]